MSRRTGFVSISEQDWEVNEKVKMTLTFKSQDNFNKRAFLITLSFIVKVWLEIRKNAATLTGSGV